MLSLAVIGMDNRARKYLAYLQEHPDVLTEIENRVRVDAGVGGVSDEDYQKLVAAGLVEPEDTTEE